MKLFRYLFFLYVLVSGPAPLRAEDKVVSLKAALDRTLANNPLLRAKESESESYRHSIRQSDRLPNPQLTMSVENAYGTLDNFESSENTVSIGQLIELGGKRDARRNLAESEYAYSSAKSRKNLQQVKAAVSHDYIDLQKANALIVIAREEHSAVQQLAKIVAAKVGAGAVLAAEISRIQAIESKLMQEIIHAEHEIEEKERNLTVNWSGTPADLGKLPALGTVTPEDIADSANENIQLLPFETAVTVAKHNREHEEAQGVPDLTLSAGYRRLEETNDNAVVGSISIPLPIFDRNSDGVAAANSRVQAAIQTLEANRQLQSLRRQNLVAEIHHFHEKLELHNDTLVPSLKKTMSELQKAYEVGKTGYGDLMDARDEYFEAERERINLQHSILAGQIDLMLLPPQ